MQLGRREFIKFIGLAPIAIGLSSCGFLQKLFQGKKKSHLTTVEQGATSTPIEIVDDLSLPKGFDYHLIASWKDKIGINPNTGEKLYFGYNNDFTSFIPLDDNYALLWVNHESVDTTRIPNKEDQKKNVGGSLLILEHRPKDNTWVSSQQENLQQKYNRRIDANTFCLMTGPVKKKFPKVKGTLANCSGGQTPWGTILSCEENYDLSNSEYGWGINEEQFGWVVEINPFDKALLPKKHSALGRFAHENTGITISKSGKIVIYMGDDAEDEHIYKYISRDSVSESLRAIFEEILALRYPKKNMQLYKKLQKSLKDSKIQNTLLSEGKLFVAKFNNKPNFKTKPEDEVTDSGSGQWQELSMSNPALAIKFHSQAELLIHTREAAKMLGATPLDRAEDIEVNPKDKSVFISFTNNKTAGNYHGSIVRLVEANNDPESKNFNYKVFVFGGKELSCPDNIVFDNKNNLWVTTDIKGASLYKEPYAYHGSNALFRIPLSGAQAGQPERFATAPVGAELTGPSFSSDFKTLFLSVQHPGEDGLKSTWPHTSKEPIPSVVAIKL